MTTNKLNVETGRPLRESLSRKSSLINEELEIYSPISQKLQQNNLRTVLRLVEAVDNPSFALSLEQAKELLLDLGLLLMNQIELDVHRNIDVFEDPLDRSDSLGNVRMIYKKRKNSDSEVLRLLGQDIITLSEIAGVHRERETKGFLSYDEELYHLGLFDDSESEDILEAKKKIVRLRDELFRVDRRNDKLYSQLQKKKRIIANLLSQHGHKEKVHILKSKSTPGENEYAVPNEFKLFEEDGNRNNQSRKLENDDKSDSQLENIKW